jgi:hypothetical protein
MNTINGQQLITRARNGLICVKQRGIDVEDFAETMRWAKSKGLIHDGPAYTVRDDNRTPKVYGTVERTCVVCGDLFERREDSVARGCSSACVSRLRSDSAIAKYKRLRELNRDGKSN